MSHTPGAGAPLSEEHAPTGVAEVDEVVEVVTRLDGRPVAEHVAVFEDAHDRLRRALDDVDGLLGPAADADGAPRDVPVTVERPGPGVPSPGRAGAPGPRPGATGVPRPGPGSSSRSDGGA
ncbi:hypothetical protein [Nocardioides sp. P86]|uniref:hypothetical protein n=1 Tax=Nocardioides sp. P86 TaxID=2939569 RepID=UPI00203C9EE2|nr:hypothetical protein [Nocardioides sp. P86]MCM3515093.1 hypothetical protein [Nocardioides sp. P86]